MDDGASHLQTMTHDLAGTASDQVLGFTYNPASQIVQRTRSNSGWEFTEQVQGSKSYAANGLNQYTSAAGVGFGYDANGNLSSDGTNTYKYDAENRLVSVTGGTSVTLSYDPMGRLWRVTGPVSGDLRFLYDGDRLTEEENAAGTLQRSYIHGSGADEPLLWYEYTGGTVRHYLHSDHQGSVVAVADDAGNALGIEKYDEWGVPSSGNAANLRFEYTGQALLPDIGLYYYKARMYSSRLGRFLQTDPVGYKDQMNLYEYVRDDPVNGRDSMGEQTDTCMNESCKNKDQSHGDPNKVQILGRSQDHDAPTQYNYQYQITDKSGKPINDDPHMKAGETANPAPTINSNNRINQSTPDGIILDNVGVRNPSGSGTHVYPPVSQTFTVIYEDKMYHLDTILEQNKTISIDQGKVTETVTVTCTQSCVGNQQGVPY